MKRRQSRVWQFSKACRPLQRRAASQRVGVVSDDSVLGWADGSIDGRCFVAGNGLDLADLRLSSRQILTSGVECLLGHSLLAGGSLLLPVERLDLSLGSVEVPLGLLGSLLAVQEVRVGRDQLLERDPSGPRCLLCLVLARSHLALGRAPLPQWGSRAGGSSHEQTRHAGRGSMSAGGRLHVYTNRSTSQLAYLHWDRKRGFCSGLTLSGIVYIITRPQFTVQE